MRRGFTLIELLIVITIIILVSIVALPTVLPAVRHRQVSEAGRILQGALVGARDKAIHDNAPAGIRLLPDPAFPLKWLPNGQLDPYQVIAYNRAVPIDSPPNYTDGIWGIYPDGSRGSSNYSAAIRTVNGYAGVPCLVVESAPVDKVTGAPLPPTNWFWNVRVGERIQFNNAGPWYTIVGPMTNGPAQGNTEMFCNNGPPGTPFPTLFGPVPCEYLLLVNGRDDDGNGWPDQGFDGVDNNGNGTIDEAAEWEPERWLGAIGQ